MRYKSLLLMVMVGGLNATTYYVATSGSDSNSGSQGAPWASFGKAASVAVGGDTVLFGSGTYGNGGVVAPGYVVTLTHSGSTNAWITFQSVVRGGAILDSGNTSTSSTCNGAAAYINLYNAAFVVIRGFVIQHACDSGIQSNNSAHDILLQWNEIRNIANRTSTTQIGLDGIYLNSSESNFTFDGNSFHNIGRTGGVSQNHFDHGIYSCAKNLTIINNVFYNMTSGWAIQMCQGASNYLIANNTFSGPCTGDGESGQIMWWGANTGITVRNNIFNMPNGAAMASYQASASGVFDHNLVYSVSSVGNPSGVSVGTGNLLGVNPQFNNPASYDFTLKSGSAAIGAGVTISSVVSDFNGVTRTVPYSMGAYQSGGVPPVVGPVITVIASNGVVSTIITWTTDQPSTSFVRYGVTSSYGITTPVNGAMVTSHAVTITGLSPNTTYHFAVGSTNGSGMLTVSGDNTVSL